MAEAGRGDVDGAEGEGDEDADEEEEGGAEEHGGPGVEDGAPAPQVEVGVGPEAWVNDLEVGGISRHFLGSTRETFPMCR